MVEKLSRRKFLGFTAAALAALGFSRNNTEASTKSNETLKPGEWVVNLSSSILERTRPYVYFDLNGDPVVMFLTEANELKKIYANPLQTNIPVLNTDRLVAAECDGKPCRVVRRPTELGNVNSPWHLYFGVADRDIFTRIGYSGEEPDNIAMAQVEHPNKGKIPLVLYSAKMGSHRVAFYAHPVFPENNDSNFAALLSEVNRAKSSGDLTPLLSVQIGNKELRAYLPQKIRNQLPNQSESGQSLLDDTKENIFKAALRAPFIKALELQISQLQKKQGTSYIPDITENIFEMKREKILSALNKIVDELEGVNSAVPIKNIIDKLKNGTAATTEEIFNLAVELGDLITVNKGQKINEGNIGLGDNDIGHEWDWWCNVPILSILDPTSIDVATAGDGCYIGFFENDNLQKGPWFTKGKFENNGFFKVNPASMSIIDVLDKTNSFTMSPDQNNGFYATLGLQNGDMTQLRGQELRYDELSPDPLVYLWPRKLSFNNEAQAPFSNIADQWGRQITVIGVDREIKVYAPKNQRSYPGADIIEEYDVASFNLPSVISGKVVDIQLGIEKGRLYAFVLTVNGDEEKYQFSKLELPLPANRNFLPFIFAQALLGGVTQGLRNVFGRRLSHFS